MQADGHAEDAAQADGPGDGLLALIRLFRHRYTARAIAAPAAISASA